VHPGNHLSDLRLWYAVHGHLKAVDVTGPEKPLPLSAEADKISEPLDCRGSVRIRDLKYENSTLAKNASKLPQVTDRMLSGDVLQRDASIDESKVGVRKLRQAVGFIHTKVAARTLAVQLFG